MIRLYPDDPSKARHAHSEALFFFQLRPETDKGFLISFLRFLFIPDNKINILSLFLTIIEGDKLTIEFHNEMFQRPDAIFLFDFSLPLPFTAYSSLISFQSSNNTARNGDLYCLYITGFYPRTIAALGEVPDDRRRDRSYLFFAVCIKGEKPLPGDSTGAILDLPLVIKDAAIHPAVRVNKDSPLRQRFQKVHLNPEHSGFKQGVTKGDKLGILALECDILIKGYLWVPLEKFPIAPSESIALCDFTYTERHRHYLKETAVAFFKPAAGFGECPFEVFTRVFWDKAVLASLLCHFFHASVINITSGQTFAQVLLYLRDIVLVYRDIELL